MINTEMSVVLFDLTKQSFEEVIQEITEIEISPTDSFIISSPASLSAVVGISGGGGETKGVEGRILLTTTYEDAQKLATYMNFGDPIESQDDVFIYFAEFANMYCGRAATHMNDKFGARAVWITPPAIFSAQDLNVITPNLVTQKAYYKTDFGSFIIDVGSVAEEDNDFGF